MTTPCPACGGTKFFHAEEEVVCIGCGLVVSEAPPDQGDDSRVYSPEDSVRRRAEVPNHPFLDGGGMGTTFQPTEMGRGRKFFPKLGDLAQRYRMKVLMNRDKMHSTRARNLSIAVPAIAGICSRLGLPDGVNDRSVALYKRALEANLVRGRDIESIAAACIYVVCRETGVPIGLKAVADSIGVAKRVLARNYRLIVVELNIRIRSPDRGANHISKIAGKLGDGMDVIRRGEDILMTLSKKGATAGKDPKGMAASVLYYTCIEMKIRHTQKEIAAAAGTTEVTLRNRLKDVVAVVGPVKDGSPRGRRPGAAFYRCWGCKEDFCVDRGKPNVSFCSRWATPAPKAAGPWLRRLHSPVTVVAE